MLGVVSKALEEGRKKIRAYHGSPHDFDRFSTDNIGTGEGAQAYGRGLYFAEREGTAINYRDQLTPRDMEYEDWLMSNYKEAEAAQDYGRMEMYERAMQHGRPQDFRDIANDTDYDEDYRALANEIADEIDNYTKADGTKPNLGHMYEVDIDASPDELLDYDTPLKNQPKETQEKVFSVFKGDLDAKISAETVKRMEEFIDNNPMLAPNKDRLLPRVEPSLREKLLESNGQEILGNIATHEPREQAEALHRVGIKGIKYADAQTRFSPKGKTHNYVVFDDKLVEIARKYGVTMPVAGAILAGTMTPEQAQAGVVTPQKDGILKDTGDVALETVSGINRAVVDGLNFFTADQVNNVLNLVGSDKRIPNLYDVPYIKEATQGNYMDDGLPRDVVRTGSEFLSPL